MMRFLFVCKKILTPEKYELELVLHKQLWFLLKFILLFFYFLLVQWGNRSRLNDFGTTMMI